MSNAVSGGISCNGLPPGRVRNDVRHRILLFVLVLFILIPPSSLFSQRSQNRYALILEDAPVADLISSRKELRRAAMEDHRQRIEAVQRVLRDELDRRDFHVTGAVQTLVNAVFVQASKDRVEELRRLPGVKGVVDLPPIRLHLDRAAGLVNAPAAWGAFGGTDEAGKGIKIGILDSGIDPNHPAFQDALLTPPPGYPKCVPADCAYTSSKVIVARSYVSMIAEGYTADPAETSRPDDLSPRDRIGHGTATAMIAAGRQNSGPSGTITGIAPRAFLGNYKIFGSPGVNDYTFGDVIIAALDDAFSDGMDVVSLSLGSPAVYGPRDTGAACGESPGLPCDIRADAVRRAIAKGMNVVVSAGNDGDISPDVFPTLNTIATPGTEPDGITVGASTNSHVFFSSVRVTGSDAPASLQRINALFGDGPQLTSSLTAPLRDVAALGGDGKACSMLPAGSLNGAIALVLRGDCFFEVKVSNARTAGAVGVIIVRDGATDFPFAPRGLASTGIPAAMIGGNPGQALKTFLSTHLDRPVTLDPTLTAIDATADALGEFSSRGPAIGTFGIKPELVAVGTDIYTATQKYDPNSDMYDPTGYGAFSGTSFSAPMVAGGAALVKQWKPSLTPAQVKSALVNTAARTAGGAIETESITGVGAGKLNLGEAVLPMVAATPATLSFGRLASGFLPQSRTVRFTNTSGGIVNLQLSISRRSNDPNTEMQITPNNIPLSPGNSADATVQLSGTLPLPGTYEGEIVVQGAGANFRIPYYYVVALGTPHILYPLLGDGFEGIVGQPLPHLLALKLTDRYGVPVQGVPVTFQPPSDGFIDAADDATYADGIAAAYVTLGPQAGEQTFTANVDGMTVDFIGTARVRPTINANGVENAGSFEPATAQKGVAPGSYIAIKGLALSPTTLVFSTPYLPLALANVSVSFDIPSAGISLPGRLHFVHPTQINVQIPWELEGRNSVRIKVSIGDVSSAVFNLPLARNSPAFFEYPLASGIPAGYEFQNPSPVGLANAVARGNIVELYCNGLGPVSNRPASGEPTQGTPLSIVADNVTVTIGGQPATVEFKGLTPTAIGLYQLNVRVPTNISAGSQPLVLTVGGVVAKTVNLPVK